MIKPKLILLNGFAGSGKSTIATKYIEAHPLAMSIEGDKLVVMLGQWANHWKEASGYRTELSKTIARAHLKTGHDVVVPFLLTDSKDAEDFENIAKEEGADFYEIMLSLEKEEGVERLLKRGKWGEDGSTTFTEKDHPEINKLFDDMEAATSQRPNMLKIYPALDEVDQTYKAFLNELQTKHISFTIAR
jgi:predicted kinase